ncbi:sugar phosphate nucleotidyltransferase [Bordetella petrii]|uniref:Sugar phosphate nucleotidyltransferase n=1 Tax=Bordetella petrii TaxID=94624 RepID=A0ABT7VXV0_9BORD|nr:sugar phosphate nucleotidyltransferase [Bordetella petrii]MDM9557769.1 sugar phosphate nucleotidyltransferase [Bordetella petrii]
MSLIPIILSGGAGKRLWPLSRARFPKPFIELDSGENLLQKALQRAQALPCVDEVLTVTRRDLHAQTVEAYRAIQRPGITLGYLLEPFARNTGPAVAAAVLACLRRHDDAMLLFLTADHVISDMDAFVAAVEQARKLATSPDIVVFGITPDRPEVSYGYIQAVGASVHRFVEKPDRVTAQRYLDSGDFLWNSGMLCATASTLERELARHAPHLLNQVRSSLPPDMPPDRRGDYQLTLDPKQYEQIAPVSIDYALLEKSDHIAVVPCQIGWSDVGNWNTLAQRQVPDAEGNRTRGDPLLHEVHNCYVRADDRLVVAAGVSGLTIVDTPDAVLVMNTDRPELVEHIVTTLLARGHRSCFQHGVTYRPTEAETTLEIDAALQYPESGDTASGSSYILRRKPITGAEVARDLDWADVEVWTTLAEQQPADADGNRTQGEVNLNQVRDCTIHAGDRLVAAAGVSQLAIVDTPDALLVMDARRPELVEPVLTALRARGYGGQPPHRTVYRPWGTYTVLEAGSNFKIKRLRIKPGASLSLQMHHHRSEHWVVLDGIAKVVNGQQETLIERNQSTYIPAGAVHQLSNPGQRDLIMIEVQSGDYLEEDDIVRFDPPPT